MQICAILVKDKRSNTVFHFAADRNKIDVASTLLKYKPPLNVFTLKNNYGRTPVEVSKKENNKTIATMYKGYIKENK